MSDVGTSDHGTVAGAGDRGGSGAAGGGTGAPAASGSAVGDRRLPRTVAIDGPAGSGKSTVARLLAERLGAQRLDTGAMYRAVAYSALRHGIDPADAGAVADLAASAAIEVGDSVVVDGEDATEAIRTADVDAAVSVVAANPAVRREMVARQQRWVAEHQVVVVEGRDIGTVVLPAADVKVYLTASVDERARRRSAQRGHEGDHRAVATVAEQLARRDDLDSTRRHSPLPSAEDVAGDALVLDTTDREPRAIVDELLARWNAVEGDAVSSTDDTSTDDTNDSAPDAAGGRSASDGTRDGAVEPVGAPGSAMSSPGWRGTGPPAGRSVSLGMSDRAYRLIRHAVRGVNRAYWRVEVDGAERVPATGPVILAPVHRSFVDFFVVSEVTRRKVFYMTKEEMWRSPRLGAAIAALGGFPVNRSGTDRQALERAQAVLQRGDVLILFPEGTRRQGPAVTDIHEGATFLAARTGAVVVPIGVGGTDRVMPLGSKVPRPVQVRLVVGEPMAPPVRSAAGRVPRSQVRTMTEALRTELQRCYDQARAAR